MLPLVVCMVDVFLYRWYHLVAFLELFLLAEFAGYRLIISIKISFLNFFPNA